MSVDLLTEDTLLPTGQNYVCISFLKDPENRTSLSGIKIRGVFDKLDDAQEFAKKLQSFDTLHNIYVGEMGKWLAFDPDPTSKAAGSPEYANDELNKIMKAHIESNEKSKLLHEQYKNQKARENVEESIKTSKENKDKIKEELSKAEDDDNKEILKQKLSDITESIKNLETKKKEYAKQEELCNKELEEKSTNKNVDV
jgi:hypothetical protein|tara:strand:+ start:55 stop:648 length:594 start_codon:yes stop_codon:yes gene_type:complete